jgi:glycosyltransferase involved in cell wall biosynthesis
MKGLYNACDATALLSRREGTPNVVLESMACGVPVLVSDAADNAIIVRDQVTGYVVRRDDDTAAAECMVKLLSNPRARNEMGVAAREHVRLEYSIDKASQKMEQIYRKCLGRKSDSAAVMRLRTVTETTDR